MKISPRSMKVLVFLANRNGGGATHEELLVAFWRGSNTSSNSVHKAIRELRAALDNDGTEESCIQTVATKGCRLMVPVTRRATPARLPLDVIGNDVPPTSLAAHRISAPLSAAKACRAAALSLV